MNRIVFGRMNVDRAFAILMLVAPGLLGGCASPKVLPPTFAVEAGQYDAAFNGAREVLREGRFEIDRVDAGAGVISTEPKRSSGVATPWDAEQSTTGDEFEDLFDHQRRIVRITFEPAAGAAQGAQGDTQLGETADVVDLRRYDGPIVASVLVVIEREHRPGWRVETVSIAFSSFTQDPALVARGMAGSYWVPVAQDPGLEGRLAAQIADKFAPTPVVRPIAPGGG